MNLDQDYETAQKSHSVEPRHKIHYFAEFFHFVVFNMQNSCTISDHNIASLLKQSVLSLSGESRQLLSESSPSNFNNSTTKANNTSVPITTDDVQHRSKGPIKIVMLL